MNDQELNEYILETILNETTILPGGIKKDPNAQYDPKELEMGIKVEMEHTNDPKVAEDIAKDHLTEDPYYYTKLKKVESEGILPRKPISEEQSAAERHAKHKEWRRKNPEKVRAQVKRHEMRSRNGKGPQAGQAARRDETRREKEQGKKKSNPTCANCGSKKNVQYDHQNGYTKGAPTKPLCHNCHTKRPQQNKKGEKSVKGGTTKVKPKESVDKSFINLIADHMNDLTLDIDY